ncbi:hypothetical protein [Leifsonia sp. Leaf264]|uniref:hypothetical protein n=1 Tax=Leifsonia sp. Leaf264 TaxID=1736314 RepID=UPI0006F827F8|nr:hypothetical protein [Leifsonia sp. Leaf264]KQO98323.1 hypothetical protein ASF30_09695 [Leifsonia sp. Leaf264]
MPQKKTAYPDTKIMLAIIAEHGVAEMGRRVGVSATSVRKELARRDITEYETAGRREKANYPSTAEMLDIVEYDSWEELSRVCGVSGNACRKELTRRGVDPLPKSRTAKQYACWCGTKLRSALHLTCILHTAGRTDDRPDPDKADVIAGVWAMGVTEYARTIDVHHSTVLRRAETRGYLHEFPEQRKAA